MILNTIKIQRTDNCETLEHNEKGKIKISQMVPNALKTTSFIKSESSIENVSSKVSLKSNLRKLTTKVNSPVRASLWSGQSLIAAPLGIDSSLGINSSGLRRC